MFLVETVTAKSDQMIINQPFSFCMKLQLRLLEAVHCDYVSVSTIYESEFRADEPTLRRNSSQSSRSRHLSVSSTSGIDFYNHASEAISQQSQALDISEHFEIKADNKTMSQCGVMCRTPLRRMDSGSKSFKELEICKEECELELTATNVDLKPGSNTLQLTGQVIVMFILYTLIMF